MHNHDDFHEKSSYNLENRFGTRFGIGMKAGIGDMWKEGFWIFREIQNHCSFLMNHIHTTQGFAGSSTIEVLQLGCSCNQFQDHAVLQIYKGLTPVPGVKFGNTNRDQLKSVLVLSSMLVAEKYTRAG